MRSRSTHGEGKPRLHLWQFVSMNRIWGSILYASRLRTLTSSYQTMTKDPRLRTYNEHGKLSIRYKYKWVQKGIIKENANPPEIRKENAGRRTCTRTRPLPPSPSTAHPPNPRAPPPVQTCMLIKRAGARTARG